MLCTVLGLLKVHKTPTGPLGIPALKLMEATERPWEVSLTGCSVLLSPKHTLLTPAAETSLLLLSTETFTVYQEMFVN